MKPFLMDTLFARCIVRIDRPDGRREIYCQKGFWSVSGADRDAVEREARHYWIQYFNDGEYNRLISPAQ